MSKVLFTIVLDASKPDATSEIEVEVHPEWAPLGAQRFMDLIDNNYYNEARVYRVIPGFIAQWGIPADPKEYAKWGENKIKDDPVKQSNKKATMSFATSGPDARGSQVFINYDDSCSQLDSQGCVRALSRRDVLVPTCCTLLPQVLSLCQGDPGVRSRPKFSGDAAWPGPSGRKGARQCVLSQSIPSALIHQVRQADVGSSKRFCVMRVVHYHC